MQRFRRMFILLALLAMVAVTLVPSSCAQPSPTPSSTTLGLGKVITDLGGDDEISALALQSDGKIVVGGSSNTGSSDFALARYALAGTLDSTFGNGGKVITDLGGDNDAVLALAIQADGRIVVAGRSDAEGERNGMAFALARYTTTGTLDPTFGDGGKVITRFGSRLTTEATGYAVAIQPDGKILVAGSTSIRRRSRVGSAFALARFTPLGSLDRNFGRGGKVTTEFGSRLDAVGFAVALSGDSKIIEAGTEGSRVVGPSKEDPSSGGLDQDLALARYTSTGSLDASFGHGGRVTADLGSVDDSANDVAINTDGKVIIAGQIDCNTGVTPSCPLERRAGHTGDVADFAVLRYTPAGTLDPAFGTGGRVSTDFGSTDDRSQAMAIQADGKMILAGTSGVVDGRYGFALARYTITGSLDPSFGERGRIITNFGSPAYASAIAIQADGKIVAAGTTENDEEGIMDFALARYTSTGDLDQSFGIGEASLSVSPKPGVRSSPSRKHANSWARGTLYGSLVFALLVLASAFIVVGRRKASSLPADEAK